MSEWKKVKLGEISLNIQTGPFGSQLHQSDYVDTGVPVIMPKDIINGKICDDTIARISSDLSCKLLKYQVEFEDIIYPRRGDISKCAIVDKSQKGWLCGTGCLKISIDKSLAKSKFIYYELQLPKQIGWIINHAIGATMLNLNTNILQNVPIDLPSINTQNRIVGILSRYDSLIENYQKQIKLLEESAQRLYKEWFVDLRFPGYENTKIVDGVPEGWSYMKIKDRYKTVLGGTPSRSINNYWGGDISWINSGEINKLRIINPSEKITIDGYNNSSTKLMPIHTTILAITGSTLGQVSYTEIETCANQSVVGIIDEIDTTSEYLYLNIYNNIHFIINKATGGAQQHINKDIINDYYIMLPDEDILTEFRRKIKPVFNATRDYLFKIEKLTEARDRLLPKLMSGEIEV